MYSWETYFPNAELPIIVGYSNDASASELEIADKGFRCLICDLGNIPQGRTLALYRETIGCAGARRYLGFETEVRPDFAHLLSCGIPGEIEGERYKRSPELVRRYLASQPVFNAPGSSIVFKRWDRLEKQDIPDVLVFFATPDVLAGLFTLASFDEASSQAVISPFGSACSSIVDHPYQELNSIRPRAVTSMLDISARPCVPPDVPSFAIPWPKVLRMCSQMEESFLTTSSWRKVRARI